METYMLTEVMPHKEKICTLKDSKPVRGAQLYIPIDRNSIEYCNVSHESSMENDLPLSIH